MAAEARPRRAGQADLSRRLTPPMLRVVWAPKTVREVARIHDYIAPFNPRAAAHLADQLFEAGNSLAFNPNRGRPVPGKPWRELVIVYPYIIRYQVVGDVVRILRVRHGMRLP